MSTENELLNNVLKNVALQPIEMNIQPLQNALKKIIDDNKFLFNDDEELTKKVILKACFEGDMSENKIDMDYLIQSISEETKNEIYERALPRIMELLKVDDLR